MQKDGLLYANWFIHSEERLKAFNQVRKGTKKIIKSIRDGSFPRDLHGSALEEVMDVIASQQEIFKGAKHAFMWKPKMRIPDIYENKTNQLAFADMLDEILHTNNEMKMLMAVETLDQKKIKGLGPAVANILYFLEPTIFCPFNTKIVEGFNYLTHSKIKLGKWSEYFKLRDGIIELNQAAGLFSKDLGAFSGFLFDIGKLNYLIKETESLDLSSYSHTQAKVDMQIETQDLKSLHYKIQYLLADIGNHIGYRAWIAANDHGRLYQGRRLGDLSLPALPKTMADLPAELKETVSLIDVIWFAKDGTPVASFEVEKSTSIMSGMNRMDDLYQINSDGMMLYIVAPNKREKEVLIQFNRPHYMYNHDLHDHIRYILFDDLIKQAEAIKTFGRDFSILAFISHFADGKLVEQNM
ncbi:hypothetical protein [Oenococcus kitaharae]|nr:type II restriction enzyme NmeDIP [Oenococcus kitaharae]OEY85495.1 type II restriction enzyme NmeDIP [Oenococcus kitaharae]OEY86348.1 type II restriction enzyme NmeDIP [Oenococcus kitaharae]